MINFSSRTYSWMFKFITLAAILTVGCKAIADTPPKHVEFLRDVAPILDRSGCSTAECHGKFGGRGGFQLSLLTLTPEDDYEPIVFGERGRRVNFAAPEQSLLLQKAAMQVPHKGGQRFRVDSPQYRTLLTWLKQGAPFTDSDPRLKKLVLTPNIVEFKKTGQQAPLKAIATYTDGTQKDVTAQTVFMTTNEAVVKVSPTGVAQAGRWGGGAVMGRYLGTIAASFVTLPQSRKGAYPTIPEANGIDALVFANLKRLNVLPSDLSSDAEFLRRVTLDLLGRLPTPDEVAAFIGDTAQTKRSKLVDAWLERPEFVDLRTLRLADLLRIHNRKFGNASVLGQRAAVLFYDWVWESVSDNKPWDQFVRELLLARGSTFQVGPANFFRVENTPNDRMENVGQAFLGVRMSCARCHKHPFDRWTTDDYWNFSAFTAKVREQGGSLYQEGVILTVNEARLRNQSVTGRNRGRVAPPTYLGDDQPTLNSKDYMEDYANWVTSPNNPFFARATVNRLWSHYFGKGIINPVDDMRATQPESVPGLLDFLAKELVQSKWDIKHIIRLIMNSRTYQLSSLPNPTNTADDRFFSRSYARPMLPHILLDMLNDAAGLNERVTNLPDKSRAIQAVLPPQNQFLNAFGQSHREFLADIDPKLEPNLVQTLMMINSPYVQNKVNGGVAAADTAKASQSDEQLIEKLYLRTLSRKPDAEEVSRCMTALKSAKNRTEAAQDMLWALLTSREFYFNH